MRTNTPGPRYTPEEIKIIMTCTHRKSCRLLPNRSPKSIAVKRHQMKNGFSRRKAGRRGYTPEQEDVLRKNFGRMTALELRDKFFPDKTVNTIQCKGNSMGLIGYQDHAPALDGSTEIVHQIVTTATARGIPAIRLDEFCGCKGYFRTHWRRSQLNLTAIARAVELLGGRLLADFTLHPFGEESKRLLACLERFTGAPAPVLKAKTKVAPKPRRDLAYPFARAADTGNKLVLSVNELVPRNMAGREDVCQTILLAILEGRITLEQLHANKERIRAFITDFMKANYEARGHAVSIDTPLRSGVRLHDTLTADMT